MDLVALTGQRGSISIYVKAVRLAKHPMDLLRRLGKWSDQVQASTPPGRIAACWHPAITADVLRQASRYPVHAIYANTAADAQASAAALLAARRSPAS